VRRNLKIGAIGPASGLEWWTVGREQWHPLPCELIAWRDSKADQVLLRPVVPQRTMEGEICSSSLRKKLTARRLRPSTPCTKYVSTMAAVSGDVPRSELTAAATVSPPVGVTVAPADPSRSSSSPASSKAPRAQRTARAAASRRTGVASVRQVCGGVGGEGGGGWKLWEVRMHVKGVVGRVQVGSLRCGICHLSDDMLGAQRRRRGPQARGVGVTDLW
jgi:hypothetical protein